MSCKKLLNKCLLRDFCLKSLIFFAALLFFLPSNSFALQDCATLPSGTPANPGVNCDYLGLPRCNTVGSPSPRTNCADIIHLPLDIDLSDQGVTVELGKNAVTECKNITLPATPVHNGNCIRFCDAPENGITPNPGVNCVERKCFQVLSGITPDDVAPGKNCEITSCKYLMPFELNDPKFDDPTKKYCDGQIKCYEFEQNKLQLLKVRQQNTMCLLHKCKPSAPECGADDTLNVSNKGAPYELEYENRILSGYSLESNTVCSSVSCLPVVNRSYHCSATHEYSNKTEAECTILNGVFASPKCTIRLLSQECDGYNAAGTPENQNCNGNYCAKKINCNLTPAEPECASSSDPIDTSVDHTDAWFYRPMPPEKATAKTGSKFAYFDTEGNPRYYLPMTPRYDKIGYERLCYDKNHLEFNGMIQSDTNDGYYLESGCSVDGEENNCDSANGCSSGYCCRGGKYCVEDAKKTWSWWGNRVETYWHYFNSHQSRSPGICDLESSGFDWGHRGNGYLYLCGNRGSLYSVPANPVSSNLYDYVGYFKGYVAANFEAAVPEYKVTVCLRYKNTLLIDETNGSQACGARECGIGCEFGSCYKKGCGRDLCHEYTLREASPKKCELNEDLMKNSRSGDEGFDCLKQFDHDVRVRVVKKSNNEVCAFVDSAGKLAYDYKYDNTFEATKDANGDYQQCANGSYLVEMKDAQGGLVYDDEGNIKKGCKFEFYYTFLGGNEKYDSDECISGTKNDAGICVNGESSYKFGGDKDTWRAHKLKEYTSFDNAGNYKFQTASDGSRVGIDLSPVIPYISRDYFDLNGVAFKARQCPRIPLRVDSGRLYNLANNSNSPKLFIPPLTIANARAKQGGSVVLPTGNEQYGKTDFHNPEIEIKFGTESRLLSLSPLATESIPVTLMATVASLNYSINVFVKKQYDEGGQKPIFCLFRAVNDSTGNPLPPSRINCVERERPEIDNKRGLLGSLNQNKTTKAVKVTANSDLTYNDYAISLQYLTDPGPNKINNNCSGDDVCSSKITLTANADSPTCDQSLEQHKICVQREECSKLNIECINNERDLYNALNGNPNPQAGTIAQMESLRKNCNSVLLPFCNAKKGLSTTGDVVSQDYNNPSTGNYYGWFNELCFAKGFETKLRQVYAYDMNGIKGKCLIDPTSPYLTDNDSDTNCDGGGKAPNCLCLEFALGSSGTVAAGQVIRRETPREAGLCIDIPTPKVCKAIDYNTKSDVNEFESSSITNSINIYPAQTYNDATGVHTTHQSRTQDTLSSGRAEFPNAIIGMTSVIGQCKGFWKDDVDTGTGILKKPLADCVNDGTGTVKWTNFRNSCVRYSCPAITTGNPDVNGNYSNNYDADDRSKTDLEKRGETHGYAMWPAKTKANDFLELVNATSCITGFKKLGSTAVTNASGVITSYSGGTNSTRLCNQIGFLLPPINACQRISCPAVNPPIPTNSSDLAAWQQWQKSGGATFPSVNASRDNTQILSSAISNGDCKTSLGFFQPPGGSRPTRSCNHLGNWGPVQNPCVTECEEIDAAEAQNDPNSGYATWAKVTITDAQYGQIVNGTFGSCISGYIVNPYLGNPQRQCLPQAVQGSPGEFRSVWGVATKSCINKCQGGVKDATNGKTIHATSSGNLTITWPDADFNQYVYASNRSDLSGLSATHFQQGRANGEYLVRRKCNTNGSWSAPEIMCATNGGSISNATYGSSGSTASTAVGVVVNDATTAGVCSSGFIPDNDDAAAVPVRQCKFLDSNNRIDQVFLDVVAGSQCVRSCAVTAGEKGDHSTLANAIDLRAGQEVELTCRAGKCGNNNNARIECNADGTQGVFDGNCRDCNGCTNTSPTTLNGDFIAADACNVTKDFNGTYGALPTRVHGGAFSICRFSYHRHAGCCGLCGELACRFMSVTLTGTCNDGTYNLQTSQGAATNCDGETQKYGGGECANTAGYTD